MGMVEARSKAASDAPPDWFLRQGAFNIPDTLARRTVTPIMTGSNLRFMRNKLSLLLVAIVCLGPTPLLAHHGQNVAFDTTHMWSTWATVEMFSYQNPHPALLFTRTVKGGPEEHWVAEVYNNPARLARIGWGKARSVEALKPGTRVKLYLATARVGGFIAFVDRMENEKGEPILSDSKVPDSLVDLDGVAGGLQPKPENPR
jgi:Family of unknown function (DUF6152)